MASLPFRCVLALVVMQVVSTKRNNKEPFNIALLYTQLKYDL